MVTVRVGPQAEIERSEMRILVTNDDGIAAEGLDVLRRIALKLSDDVWVIAPERNQSGASHSMTLHGPLRLRQMDERTFVIRGTPTDCVIMGVRHLLIDNPPDLVLSGVNHGSNLAEDVTYSGTIAAAIEGTMLGIRSIALSQVGGSVEEGKIYWQTPLDTRARARLQAARKRAGRRASCSTSTIRRARPRTWWAPRSPSRGGATRRC